ncbi:SpvB/TcaC N-terminal domain-containing protein [Nocardia sp. NPDC051990]
MRSRSTSPTSGPISTSARVGSQLSLSYDSGTGNGPFGFG